MRHPESFSPDRPWGLFQGGELEGVRPRRQCCACRAAAPQRATAHPQVICFACYRADFDHDRRLKAAGQLETATGARFRWIGPLEPVNRARLEQLRAVRGAAKMAAATDVSARWSQRRLQAQRAARRALDAPVAAPSGVGGVAAADRRNLPLPAAWLPFVGDGNRRPAARR